MWRGFGLFPPFVVVAAGVVEARMGYSSDSSDELFFFVSPTVSLFGGGIERFMTKP